MAIPNDFEKLIPHSKRAGFAATTLAAVITAKFGYALGEDFIAKLAMAGLLSLCTFIVGYALVFAWHAYSRGMRPVGHAAVGLFLIAVSVEFLSHTGFTAANRDATIADAGMQKTSYADSRGLVKSAGQEVSRLEELLRMKPAMTAAEARAKVDSSKAHKWFTSTEKCTATKGPQTREFCDAFRSAEAALKGWDDISVNEEKLVAAKATYAAAIANSSSKSVAHASGASQGIILASMFTMDENPNSKATFWAGVGISAILALFAIAAGGLLNFIAYAFDAVISVAPAKAAVPMQVIKDRFIASHTIRTADGKRTIGQEVQTA